MRPENVLAWSIGVEVGAPPPSQPPFDEFGNPVVNVTANMKEWKREFQAQQAEKEPHERGFRQQNSNGPKIASSKTIAEGYIEGWRGAGTSTSTRKEREKEARERGARLQLLRPPKREPSRFDEADLADRERMRKILFPHGVPKEKEEVKLEPQIFKIPQRKPVPKSDDTTPRPLSPPQIVLLRNGEGKRVERMGSYQERVRELGYPEILCPLPMRGVDCTGARVVKQNDHRLEAGKDEELELGGLGDRAGSQANLTREMLALAGEFRTLKLGQKRL